MKCPICKNEMFLRHKSVIEWDVDSFGDMDFLSDIKNGIVETWYECIGDEEPGHPNDVVIKVNKEEKI